MNRASDDRIRFLFDIRPKFREHLARAVGDVGDAPVHHENLAVVGHHDVLRLEVAVNHSAIMRVRERIADFDQHLKQGEKRLPVQAAGLEFRDEFLEVGPFDPLHREEKMARLVEAEVVNRNNVRVIQRGGDLDLAHEFVHNFMVVEQVRMKRLARDVPQQCLVKNRLHVRHPTGPKQPAGDQTRVRRTIEDSLELRERLSRDRVGIHGSINEPQARRSQRFLFRRRFRSATLRARMRANEPLHPFRPLKHRKETRKTPREIRMTKSWHLDRRTLLRGAGASLALPFLECMGETTPSGELPKRFCSMYFPFGASTPPDEHEDRNWGFLPTGEGRDFQFTESTKALEPHRDQVAFLQGLSHPNGRSMGGHDTADIFLTAAKLKGSDLKNSISIDQVIAGQTDGETRFSSLTISSDGGVGEPTRSSTLSFSRTGQPIPALNQPRMIFDQLFGKNSDSLADQRRQLLNSGTMLDRVLDHSKTVRGSLGKQDQEKFDEYLDSVRQIEQRVERSQQWLEIPKPEVDASGLHLDADDNTPRELVQTIYDLIFLAFQTDSTRVATYQLGSMNGATSMAGKFPQLLGIGPNMHGVAHGAGKAGGFKRQGEWDQFLASQLAYFMDRLGSTPEGEGSLLDRTVIFYGSSNSRTHNNTNYPLVLAGGRDLGLRGGALHKFDAQTPLSNLFVSVLNKFGVEGESFVTERARVRVLDAGSGLHLPDVVDDVSIATTLSWSATGDGFYYFRSPLTRSAGATETRRVPGGLWFHRLGTEQGDDVAIVRQSPGDRHVYRPAITSDGERLVVSRREGTATSTTMRVFELDDPDATPIALFDDFDARFIYLGNKGTRLYFQTNFQAPNGRVVAVDLLEPDQIVEVIPETGLPMLAGSNVGGDVLGYFGGHFVLGYLQDGLADVRIYTEDGTFTRTLELPPGSSMWGALDNVPGQSHVTVSLLNPFSPGHVVSFDAKNGVLQDELTAEVGVKVGDFTVKRVFVNSDDGTRVPMSVVHRKNINLDGSNPALIYGYGMHKWVSLLFYQAHIVHWLELGGVYAMPAIRGGGEYGDAWHDAGIKINRQNAIDDFVAAGRWLIDNGYTSPKKLAANGGSASGALAGMIALRHGDVFAATTVDYPIADLVRAPLYGNGIMLVDEYGSIDDPEESRELIWQSPYHQVAAEHCYLPSLIMVGEDDKVALPLHGYKLAAALQFSQRCDNPVLLYRMPDTGHNYGLSATSFADNTAIQIAFLREVLGF